MTTDDDVTIVVPETDNPLCNRDFEDLKQSIDICAPSNSYGIDLFASTLDFVNNRIQSY